MDLNKTHLLTILSKMNKKNVNLNQVRFYEIRKTHVFKKNRIHFILFVFLLNLISTTKKPSNEVNLSGQEQNTFQDPQNLRRASLINSKMPLTGQNQLNFSSVKFNKSLKNLEKDDSFQTFLQTNQGLVGAFTELNKSQQKIENILAELNKWKPDSTEFKFYKEYFSSIWTNDIHQMKSLFLKLKSEKKFIRLRLELIVHILNEVKLSKNKSIQLNQIDNNKNVLSLNEKPHLKNDDIKKIENQIAQDIKIEIDKNNLDHQFIAFLISETRVLLKQLNGTSEAEVLESEYLSWLYKNKLYAEICKTEKNRWVSEPSIEFVDLVLATQNCEVNYSEFLTRIRRLLFAAKDYQALREIEQYSVQFKLKDWQKSYAMAVFHSLSGDPATGFQNLQKFESDILNSSYDLNYFYISQRAGELEKSEQIINKLIKENKNFQQELELKFQKAFLFYQTKKYNEAFLIFDDLFKIKSRKTKKKSYKVTKDFDQLAWLRAWSVFLSQDYAKALKLFSETIPFAQDEARLLYWISETHRRLGNDQEALEGFQKLSRPLRTEKTFSYYNLMAFIRLNELKKDLNAKIVSQNSLLNLNQKAEYLIKLKQPKGYFPIPSADISYSELSKLAQNFTQEELKSDEGEIQISNSDTNVLSNEELSGVNTETDQKLKEHLNFAKLLLMYGESDLAKWHLFEIEKSINTKNKAIILAQFYHQNHFYHRALSLMNRFTVSQQVTLQLQSDSVVWSSLYPEAYKDDVLSQADKMKIDPYLILSIMRAETQYKSDAISPVGAVGLMQFMPYSAQKVAKLIDDSIITDHLFTPEKSVEYGAIYLKKLSIEMNQQTPLIAASYNGGPHRVKSWLKNLGAIDFDIFIEHIPFAETRTYVKRVLTYNATYEKLYKKQIDLQKYQYLLKPVNFDYKQNMLTLREEWDPFHSEIKKLRN